MTNTTELTQRFDRLQRKREEASKNVIQLQAKVDSAEEAIKQIGEGWQKTYGFSDYDSAVKKLQELESEITLTMATCEGYLDSVEGEKKEYAGFGEI